MDWCSQYDNIFPVLTTQSISGIVSFLNLSGEPSTDLITLSTVILLRNMNDNGVLASEFLESVINKNHETQYLETYLCLSFLIKIYADNSDSDTDKKSLLNELNKLIVNCQSFQSFEMKTLLFTLLFKHDTSSLSNSDFDKLSNQIQEKISYFLGTNNEISPYIDFLLSLKYELSILKLNKLQKLQKWTNYLSLSYSIVFDGLLNDKSENIVLLNWYSKQATFPTIISFFVKSLLLEPYGSYKNKIMNVLKQMKKTAKYSEFSIEMDILAKFKSEKLFNLSIEDNKTMCDLKEKFCDSEMSFRIIWDNLLDTNIVFISKKFSTIRISTLYTLCGLDPIEYPTRKLIKSICNLSFEKKIIVRIDQHDGILSFPFLKVDDSHMTNLIFSDILPKVLEKDWECLNSTD